GGNAQFIVFDDADLDAAVEGALASKYRNAGQTCVCANRLYVQDGVYDRFAAKLADKVKGFKVGAGNEPGVVIGPLIDENGVKKVEAHVADALNKGAKVILGGKRHSRGGHFRQIGRAHVLQSPYDLVCRLLLEKKNSPSQRAIT